MPQGDKGKADQLTIKVTKGQLSNGTTVEPLLPGQSGT